MDGYKHYIRVDANGIVIDGYADWQTDKRREGEIQLTGSFPRQFQMNLYTERLQYKYKVLNGQMVERTQEELDAERAARPPAPKTPEQKEMDKLKMDNTSLNDQLIGLWETLLNAGVL